MSSIVTFTLNDPGEGLTEAEIIELKVEVGDRVEINDVVVTVETAKSAVELPCHVAGTVAAIHVREGDEVPVGAPLVDIDTSGGAAGGGDAKSASAAQGAEGGAEEATKDAPAESTATGGAEPTESGPTEPGPSESGPTESEAAEAEAEPKMLVGYGASEAPQRRRRRQLAGPTDQDGPQVPIDRILAKPPVRKLAKDLGVALKDIVASGENGIVTREDVLAASQRSFDGQYFTDEHPQAPEDLDASMKTPRHAPFPGVTSDEATTRVPIRSVRKRTAEAMVSSAFTAPHVTVFNEVDMTATMDLVAMLKASREWKDVRVSPLAVLARAVLVAIRRNPEVNASWDEDEQEIVYKHFVNLGIAAATPRGLIVPNIKDAHLMTLKELAVAINDLSHTARAGQTPLSATRGGTITITNFGVFGIDSGTPILNPGESVIVGFGAIKEKPWVVDGELAVRKTTQLALSFDHRLIDGALGSELLRDISAVLEKPELGLVWG